MLHVDVDRRLRGLAGDGMRAVGVVLDERPEQGDHCVSLLPARRPQVHVLVVELAERRQRFGHVRGHADTSGLGGGRDHGADERAELARPVAPAAFGHDCREHVEAEDAGGDRVLEVVTHIGDPVGPGDHLALRGLRGGKAPRVVADPVERLCTQVQRLERDIGAPGGVIETAVQIGRQRVLAGMATRAVAAVVPDRDRLDQCDVEPQRLGHRAGDLGDLQRVGHPRSLVVLWEHEHLGLPGEPPEGRVVENTVAIAFEAGPVSVGLLIRRSVAGAQRWRRTDREVGGVAFLVCLSRQDPPDADLRRRIGVRDHHIVGTEPGIVAGHGRRPSIGALRRIVHGSDDTRLQPGRDGCPATPAVVGRGVSGPPATSPAALAWSGCPSSSTSANSMLAAATGERAASASAVRARWRWAVPTAATAATVVACG